MPGITDPTQPYFKNGGWGWDGSLWRKLPMIWGYSDRWSEAVYGIATGAGNAVAQTAAVPSGYIYVVQAVSTYHNAGASKIFYASLVGGGVGVALLYEAAAPSLQNYFWQGVAVLKESDYVKSTAWAPGDGKRVDLALWGYKMKIGE